MSESNVKTRFRSLFQPARKSSMLTLLVIGALIGMGGLFAFDAGMQATPSGHWTDLIPDGSGWLRPMGSLSTPV